MTPTPPGEAAGSDQPEHVHPDEVVLTVQPSEPDFEFEVAEPLSIPEKGTFLTMYGLLESDLEEAAISWADLKAIGEKHLGQYHELERTAEYISSRLRKHPAVHSVKWRVKNPQHLMKKVLRKRKENRKRLITLQTYSSEITDLIGIRVLHLFKGDWLEIHNYIMDSWPLVGDPTANIRRGDPEPQLAAFRAAGCQINEHKYAYRSVHYLVKSQPAKSVRVAEIQVRTIFEEGWSEIDHRIRYPDNLDNQVLNQFLILFNRAAGSADEMGTFIQELRQSLDRAAEERSNAAAEHAKTVEQLKTQIDQLQIDAKEKRKLEEKVRELQRRAATAEASASPQTTEKPVRPLYAKPLHDYGLGSLGSLGSLGDAYGLGSNLRISASSFVTPQRCLTCGKEMPSWGATYASTCDDCSGLTVRGATSSFFFPKRCRTCGKEVPPGSPILSEFCDNCRGFTSR